MKILKTKIKNLIILKSQIFKDNRGFLRETFKKNVLNKSFPFDITSFSKKNVIRGLHFQEKYSQAKLITVTHGKILDVAVDIRHGSPTFGTHITEIISAEKWNQIFVPKGFAHGFITLEDSTEVIYKVSNYYAPDFDFGIKWNDPEINIDWGVNNADVIISEKDQNQPYLNEIDTPFVYGEN